VTMVLALATALVTASVAHAATDARLAQAESLAKKREIDAAADLYRALLKDGVDGAGVRYNLGTLALEQGRVGEAVLELRIAHRLAPGDDDIKHNLTVALDARTDRLAGEATVDPIRVVGEHISPLTARLALAIPLALLGALLALLGFVDARRALLRSLAIGCAVITLFGGVVYAARKSVESAKEAVIVVDATPALKDADDAAAVAFTAHAGLFGDVVDESAGFSRIRFENGLEAWIKNDALGFE
jgi:tetratricopeptide (TPR) repeat protein